MRVLKEDRNKSLDEFSAELEISRSALQEYLSGNGNPRVATINHIADKLGIDARFLVSGMFTDKQIKVFLQMLDVLKLTSGLSPVKRQRCAELLLELILLWGDGANDE